MLQDFFLFSFFKGSSKIISMKQKETEIIHIKETKVSKLYLFIFQWFLCFFIISLKKNFVHFQLNLILMSNVLNFFQTVGLSRKLKKIAMKLPKIWREIEKSLGRSNLGAKDIHNMLHELLNSYHFEILSKIIRKSSFITRLELFGNRKKKKILNESYLGIRIWLLILLSVLIF